MLIDVDLIARRICKWRHLSWQAAGNRMPRSCSKGSLLLLGSSNRVKWSRLTLGPGPKGRFFPISSRSLTCAASPSIRSLQFEIGRLKPCISPQLRLPLLFMQMTNIPNWNKFKEFIKSMQISCIMGTGTWLKPLLRPLYGSPGDFSCFLFEISRNFWSRDFPLKFYRICEMRILGIFVWPNKVSTQMGSMPIDNEEPSARARCTRIHHPTN